MIYDLAAGQSTLLFETDDHIEAPNWAPDKARLIFNGGGLLFEISLIDQSCKKIDTGGYGALNNDHGISPDGRSIAFSDNTETITSCIYLMETGQAPRRVTAQVPSYWHGWSPDGETLAYTAKRDGAFDIFTISVAGGAETRLTRDMGHCDGPDYTPDGRWIWFNADKTGSAQLWRMRTNGTGLEQMTDDDRVNWFPHPSPDGETVVYLSYPTGTLGHPGGLDVELRAMPASGGPARTLETLHGGQGTINVPSWCPDGSKFAFVQYERKSK